MGMDNARGQGPHVFVPNLLSMARTKIVCTLGPATEDAAVIAELIQAGMRVARINCSHGSAEEHAALIRTVRKVSNKIGTPVSVLYDLSGPKVRTGTMAEPLPLEAGQEFTLTSRDDVGPGEAPLGFRDLPRSVAVGQRILFDDGALACEVLAVDATDIRCRALNSAPLGSHKGINLPGATLPIPALTEKDAEDLRAGLTMGIDWVAMSFVRDAADLEPARAIMAEMGISRPVIAKVEKHEAVANLDAIVAAFDGIMVARGDLGVEIPFEQLPLLQKRIIKTANRAGKPVITATQMLDSMIRNPRPTRAEVTDVATAILDGTDAVMLSGETSVGKYPLEAVRAMQIIAAEAETALPKDGVAALDAPEFDQPTGSMANAAVDMASHLRAGAIVATTVHGNTARLVSKNRPQQPIIAVTSVPETYTQLPLLWGVKAVLAPGGESPEETVDRAVRVAVRIGAAKDGDLVIVVAVDQLPLGVVTRASDTLRIARVRTR